MVLRTATLLLCVPLASPWAPLHAWRRRDAAEFRRCRCVLAAAAESDDAGGAGGPSIFLVDDQPGMRSAVERYLSDRGFRCRAFESGSDALDALARANPPPDAMVTDVLMPGGLDGLDLLRAIRSDARLCALPVVLLTAKGLTPDRIAGFDAGCSAYLSKPFDPEELVAVLRSLTSNALLAKSVREKERLGDDVAALRDEMANMRQLLRALLQLQLGQTNAAAAGDLSDAPIKKLAELANPSNAAGGDPLVEEAVGQAAAQKAARDRIERVLKGDMGQRSDAATPASSRGASSSAALEHVPHLTRREKSVLELVGEGMLNKEIASQLGIGLR